jgi:tRNA pseudouridine55 synthase
MSRRRKGRDVHGIILLDKPAGFSSNQAVQKVRWLLQARKAGHTGSLDPFATGMLPICLGEASKTAGFMLDASKTYLAEAFIGQATTPGDIEGDVCLEQPLPAIDPQLIEDVLASFCGEIEQVPPMYSALKHQGQPLYKLARAGQEVERKPRPVTIHSLDLVDWKPPLLTFKAHCSKGTYVRTLAEDIAAGLGSCAHLKNLRRLDVEPFRERDMISLEALENAVEAGKLEQILQPVDAGLVHWQWLELDAESAIRFSHGNPVETDSDKAGLIRVRDAAGKLLGIGEMTAQKLLKPRRIMHL